MIDRLVDAGIPADRCCRVLGVACQNCSKQKRTPTNPTQLRRQWLTGLIREVHVASRGTYGYRHQRMAGGARQRVPVTVISSNQGPEHCNWDSATFPQSPE